MKAFALNESDNIISGHNDSPGEVDTELLSVISGKRMILVLIIAYNAWRIVVLRGLIGSALDHRSLPPEFESRVGHIWRVFHLSLRFFTVGGRSAHLVYHVHKSGRKTSIIINILKQWHKHWVEALIQKRMLKVELMLLQNSYHNNNYYYYYQLSISFDCTRYNGLFETISGPLSNRILK